MALVKACEECGKPFTVKGPLYIHFCSIRCAEANLAKKEQLPPPKGCRI
jgi:endogenous inhibitor of DNA gyrase (YacG/DUF329 family)